MRPDPNDRPTMSEILKHPWLIGDDLTDSLQSVAQLRRKSDISQASSQIANPKTVTSLRRPLIIRPQVPQSSISTSSFCNQNQPIQSLIRRVPPSSAKRNKSSMVQKGNVTQNVVMAQRAVAPVD